MCVWLGTNSSRKIPESIRWNSLELKRCLDDRLTLLDKELYAVVNSNDTKTEEKDLEKVRKCNGEKSTLFNEKNPTFYKICWTNYGCYGWRYQNFRLNWILILLI